MTPNHLSIWENCLRNIKRNINPQSYSTWFEPIKAISLSKDCLTIQVPNKFFYEYLEEHFVSILKSTVRSELGSTAKLEYQILVNNHKTPGKINKIEKPTPPIDIKNPFVIPGIQRPKVDSQLNPNYTFDSFIEGDCNKLLRSAGIAIASQPGATSFNPLVVYGDVGLGKTHLAQAIGNMTLQKNQEKTVLYVTSERFTNQLIENIKNNTVNDFLNFYQMLDVLIVDDIQFLAGRAKTQEIFFNIFNQLHQNSKQIILTSDRAPKDMKGLEERLISRFKWGLTADLTVPDFETKLAIFSAKMEKEGVSIPSNVREYICMNIKNNIRELEGVLVSLVAQSTLNHRHIDIMLAQEVVENFVNRVNKEISVENIKKLVAEHFKVPVELLHAKTRKRSVVIARQLSMYLAKNHTNNTLKHIGSNFGDRDHTTVLYSCKSVKNLMDTDTIFKDTVKELEKQVKMNLVEQD